MTSWLLLIGSTCALVAALGVVVFESPLRSVAALVTLAVCVAGVFLLLDEPLLTATTLWSVVGASALVVLTVISALNLTSDEQGRRRVRIAPSLAVPAFAFLAWRFGGLTFTALNSITLENSVEISIKPSVLLVEQHAAVLLLFACALFATAAASFLIARRSPRWPS